MGYNVARFSDRGERERYMDSLERQMEQQREQIQNTLDQASEGSGRNWTVIEKLRSSLPGFPSRTPARTTGEREKSPQVQESQASTLRDWSGDGQGARWPWWRRIFGR